MVCSKPNTLEEVRQLLDAEDIEVWIDEEIIGGRRRLLICDYRRTVEEGELYEIIV